MIFFHFSPIYIIIYIISTSLPKIFIQMLVYSPKYWQYCFSEVLFTMSNNNNKKSFGSRFAGKGYYIALVLCAVAIGISGYLYYHNAGDPSLDDPNSTIDALGPSGNLDTKPSTVPTNPSSTQPTKKPLRTAKPVSGEVLMDYAMDCLCYNPTPRDWRTHNGMDFAAAAGTTVQSAADGTVYTIYSDETMGTTVVIRHQDGYVTTYSSLREDVLVSVGQDVTMGQAIGYVGSTALVETILGDHVHFSVSCNGEMVDPEDFFLLGN